MMVHAAAAVSCHCTRNHGTTRIAGWWICAGCRLPKSMYLASVYNDPAAHGMEKNEMGIIVFDGGPLDGQAYETKTLLGTENLQLPIHQYVWTSEKKTSERTGDTAQIWRFKEDSPVPGPRATINDPHPSRRALAEVTANEAKPVEFRSADETGIVDVAAESVSETAEPAAEHVESTPQPVVQPDGERGARDDLVARRKAHKVSVGAFAEKSGLAGSKVVAIEKGYGKRVKSEEIAQYMATLESIESRS